MKRRKRENKSRLAIAFSVVQYNVWVGIFILFLCVPWIVFWTIIKVAWGGLFGKDGIFGDTWWGCIFGNPIPPAAVGHGPNIQSVKPKKPTTVGTSTVVYYGGLKKTKPLRTDIKLRELNGWNGVKYSDPPTWAEKWFPRSNT